MTEDRVGVGPLMVHCVGCGVAVVACCSDCFRGAEGRTAEMLRAWGVADARRLAAAAGAVAPERTTDHA